ncbi:MAG: YebC/PmpR family DNA-binding transcriptional regulator, partial [Elusimicrobia bacterium]|nr:YebC/PmpR family DNA-binding transcriptional regulator [Elusimicrobiota bacterium]
VSWMFTSRGYLTIAKGSIAEDKLMGMALDAGAEDFKSDDEEVFEITVTTGELENVKASLESQGVSITQAEVTMLPQSYVKLTGHDAEQMLALMDGLEDHDDVKTVYANFDIPKAVMERAC